MKRSLMSLPLFTTRRSRVDRFRYHSCHQCSSNALEPVDDDVVVEKKPVIVVTKNTFRPTNVTRDSLDESIGSMSTKRQHRQRPRVSTPLSPFRVENVQATQLVDHLLHTTQEMMRPQQQDSIDQKVPTTHHLIAFSGGVDSSLVAALVFELHEPSLEERVQAVLGISPAVSAEQICLAQEVAQHIGVPLKRVPTSEGLDETYIANEGQACLACKTHLYSTLQAIVDNHIAGHGAHKQQQQQLQLYNGTNSDDLQDPTRLGLIAADQFHVLSPLSSITKSQVRTASKHLGLPNWNYAASPCLRSRLALGVQATQDHLQRIEQAERFVRQQLVILDETSNLRVRLLANSRACIEVDAHILPDVQEQLEGWRSHFCDTLQVNSVYARAFRSGSVATR